jgi:hypothetical protein
MSTATIPRQDHTTSTFLPSLPSYLLEQLPHLRLGIYKGSMRTDNLWTAGDCTIVNIRPRQRLADPAVNRVVDKLMLIKPAPDSMLYSIEIGSIVRVLQSGSEDNAALPSSHGSSSQASPLQTRVM